MTGGDVEDPKKGGSMTRRRHRVVGADAHDRCWDSGEVAGHGPTTVRQCIGDSKTTDYFLRAATRPVRQYSLSETALKLA